MCQVAVMLRFGLKIEILGLAPLMLTY